MASRNIFDYFKPDATVPRNGFDLTRHEKFTTRIGQLVPVSCVETIPNSTYKMRIDALTRTMPLNTAAFVRLKQNWYLCFVPYSQLNKNTYEMLMQRSDHQSALVMNDSQTPVFKLGDLVREILDTCKLGDGDTIEKDLILRNNNAYDIAGFNFGYGALMLLDQLGYGWYGDFVNSSTDVLDALQARLNDVMPNPLRLQAYQKIWHCFFRDRYFDNPNENWTLDSQEVPVGAKCFNTDDISFVPTSGLFSFDIGQRRQMSDIIRQFCQPRYVKYKSDLFMSGLPGTQFGAVSSVPLSSDFSFEIGDGQVDGTTDSDRGNWSMTGTWANNLNVVSDTEGNVGFKRSESPLSISDSSHTHNFSAPLEGVEVAASGQGASLFDVLKLVEAQAIQKFRQKSMFAGNKTIDQFRAHHGVVPRYLADEYPDFIGSVDNEIQINEVISQADTAAEGSNLGEIAGRGYGASDAKEFTYQSNDYGILMLLTSIVPENDYNSYGLDRANQLVFPNDFYQSEYQNIGLEAVPTSLLSVFNPYNEIFQGDDNPDDIETVYAGFNGSGVWNFAPRYYNYKWYPSKVHGVLNTPPSGYSNQFNAYVMSRWDLIDHQNYVYPPTEEDLLDSTLPLTLRKLYVNPRLANPIFAQNITSDPLTDQFVVWCKFICESVEPLSTLGLPQF